MPPILLKGSDSMSDKHDRTAPRKVEDIERKYNFEKKFAEILGLIDESRDKVDSVESNLRNEIKQTETSIKRNTEEIVAKATEDIQSDIEEVHRQVEMKLDADSLDIIVEEKLKDGVNSVETTTGYRFDADGLNISKSGEEIKTTIDNTGLVVDRNGIVLLSADNTGVAASELHAQVSLKIGNGIGRTVIENYGNYRTGVFWNQ